MRLEWTSESTPPGSKALPALALSPQARIETRSVPPSCGRWSRAARGSVGAVACA